MKTSLKKDLRKEALEKRKQLSDSLKTMYSDGIFNRLLTIPSYIESKETMCYLDFNNEVSTSKIVHHKISQNSHIYIPVTHDSIITPACIEDTKSLQKSTYGILEAPAEKAFDFYKELIDLIIVPGIVFDITGNRIGFGKGYYDKFLGSLDKKVPTIAVAYDFQIKDWIPSEPHDIKMDYIVTPTRTLIIQS